MTKLLDHGYLKFIEGWGSDERVVEAARMSTDKGFLGWGPKHVADCASLCPCNIGPHECNCTPVSGDEKLLKYLYDNKHSTPFEMAGLVVEVQAPIFVFREWHRHRTQSYNEMSARYTPLPDLNYVPTVDRLLINSATNKQAGVVKGAAELTEKDAYAFHTALMLMYEASEELYQHALRSGV